MNGHGSRIKALRKKAGMTQADLADRLNVAQRTVASWEGETREPGMDTLAAMARVLNTSTEYIINGTEPGGVSESDPLPKGLVRMNEMPHHYIPLVGSVAAGIPIYMDECYDVYVDSPREADFALRVEGDSMNPTYLDGDIVYIKSVPDVYDGQVCVVSVDDSCTLKHLYHIPGGVQLVSDNPAYPPMLYTAENSDSLRVLGIIVGFTRLYKRKV